MLIRNFDPVRDDAFLRSCIIELQAVERRLDARLPAGERMVEAYCDLLFERCRNWDGTILIAEDAGSPVGLLTLFCRVPQTEPDEPPGSYALVSDLLVVSSHRRRSIASTLMSRAETIAIGSGAPTIRLEVMARNRIAREFYERHGWTDRVVTMEKTLPPTRDEFSLSHRPAPPDPPA